MKKVIVLLFAAALFAVLPLTAYAAHGNRHGGPQGAGYPVCAVESCAKAGSHIHGGKTYAAHYCGDGHDYHAYCSIEDCTLAGHHSHDGEYCFGHTADDGHDYHGYCGIADCDLTGYHEHDGTYCFGHAANDGCGYPHLRGGRRGHCC